MEPVLSICIPIYNRSRFLVRMLERFLEDRDLFEEKVCLYVSDNCSTEDLESIVNGFIGRGLRVQYHRNRENLGPDLNICACFRAGTGRYTWVLGSDDIPVSGFLRGLLPVLEEGNYGLIHLGAAGNGMSIQRVPEDFFVDMNVWITFISANIVATRFIAEARLEEYATTSLSQVPLYLEAGFSSRANLTVCGTYLEEQNDAFLNGGYNLFGVFADNLLAMVRTKVPAPFPESAFRHFKRRLFRDFLAENVLNLLILKRNSNFDTQSGWEIIRRHFGKEWYFLPDLAAVVARIGFRKLSGTHNKKA